MSEFTVVVVLENNEVVATANETTVEVQPIAETIIDVSESTTEVTVGQTDTRIEIIQANPILIEISEVVATGACCDPTESTANVILFDVPCMSSVFIGAAVRMNTGGTAQNALADSLANANTIGLVESKSGLNLCNIRVFGVTEAVYVGLDVTREYYLSDSVPGLVTTTIPTASGSIMLKLGQPFSATELLVNKGQQVVRL